MAILSFHACPLAALGEGKAGGMNSYVRELARHLARLGIQVDVFTRHHGGDEPEESQLAPGARVVHLPGGPPRADVSTLHPYLAGFAAALLDYARVHNVRYDVLHAHYWLSGEVGQRAATSWGVPLVITFHTLARTKAQALPTQELPLRAKTESELVRRAALTIATTPHEKDSLVQLYGGPDERVQIVPCGVDLEVFHPIERGEARRALGLDGEKVVLYVGRLERIKGVELLLRTAAIMDSSVRVLIVGGGEGDGEAGELKDLAKKLGVEGRVRFVGRVPQAQLPTYYSAADVCVVPSYYESFGLAALEAMACGTPVVATRVGGLPWVVQHNRTGYLVPWHCPEPFANWVETLLSNEELRHRMGEAGLQFARTMGWTSIATRIAELYGSLQAPIQVRASAS